MAGNKAELIEAGKWLAEARSALGASTTLVASMATLIANRQGDSIKIYQQQISEIENATPDKGPKGLRPWFRYVRAAFDSGLIADALGRATADNARSAPADENFFIHNEAGDIVGRITWYGRAGPGKD
jgi:hypothetical protein